jgi:alpha-L-fucosidase
MESWGYKKDEDYYTDRHLEASIDKYLARDANYLLNVGPTDEGVIPPESAAILKRIGTWKQSVNESFSETEPGNDIIQATGILATTRKQTVYIHLNQLPAGNGVKLKPITVKPQKAVLLNNEKAVDFEVSLCPSDHITQQPYLRIRNLPVDEFANSVMVVRLDFDQPLSEIKTPAKNTDIELTK